MKKTHRSRFLSMFLVACLLGVSVIVCSQAGTMQRRNPEAGKKKAAKRIGIGTAIGAGAGGLLGGRKGALIGAGAGAGAGTVYHIHKKRSYRNRRNR